jgi:hypothetical protein
MEEQAEATEELIANLTESHMHQMEIIIKNTTKAMKEMMALVKSENKPSENKPLTNNNDMPKGGRNKRQERRKMYNNAPICKHCNRSKAPCKERRGMLGTQSKCSIPSIVLESSKST